MKNLSKIFPFIAIHVFAKNNIPIILEPNTFFNEVLTNNLKSLHVFPHSSKAGDLLDSIKKLVKLIDENINIYGYLQLKHGIYLIHLKKCKNCTFKLTKCNFCTNIISEVQT